MRSSSRFLVLVSCDSLYFPLFSVLIDLAALVQNNHHNKYSVVIPSGHVKRMTAMPHRTGERGREHYGKGHLHYHEGKQCHLKVDLDQFKYTTNSGETIKNKNFYRSVFGVLREKRKYNHLKCSIKTIREGRKGEY